MFYFFLTRNAFLHDKGGIALPKAQKTGTTICGAVFEGGVVVGADTRATAGDIVADKNCNKVLKQEICKVPHHHFQFNTYEPWSQKAMKNMEEFSYT